jgi:ABC-2 type transport system ATP-binding protein
MGADGAEGAAVRRAIGFLPEESPLQPDLSVDEYLRFRADLYGVPRRDRAAAIDRALARCQVADVRRRLCGQLSKGYRQRVGLAGAIVHGPTAIVLDEPTSGLDPAQVRDFRALLRELAGGATVLFSSHVLAEVEASCDRAVLVDRGRVVADGTLPELRARGAAAAVLLLEAERDCAALLRALPGVREVRAVRGDDGWWRVQVDAVDAGIADAAARAIAAGGVPLRRAELREASLEDLFLRMVPRAGGAA